MKLCALIDMYMCGNPAVQMHSNPRIAICLAMVLFVSFPFNNMIFFYLQKKWLILGC